MGNKIVTCDLLIPAKQKRLNTYLKPEQIKLVQGSWDLIKDDLSKLGIIVFLRFFETEPDMKSIFPKIVRMNNESQLEWDIDREMLQKHAVTVMEGLGAAVESLDDSDFLNSVLISIGQTHFHRHVRPQMLRPISQRPGQIRRQEVQPWLPSAERLGGIAMRTETTTAYSGKRLWPSLSYGLQKVLQEAYNRRVSDAWKKVFDYVCVYMKFGIENPEIDPDVHQNLTQAS